MNRRFLLLASVVLVAACGALPLTTDADRHALYVQQFIDCQYRYDHGFCFE